MRGKERKEKAAERKKKPEKGYAGKEFEWGQGRERLENRDQGTEVKRGGRTGEGEARSFLPGLPRSPFTRKKEGLSQRSFYILSFTVSFPKRDF